MNCYNDESTCDLKISVSLGSDVLGYEDSEAALSAFSNLIENDINEGWASALVSVEVRDSTGETNVNVVSLHPQLDEEEIEEEIQDLIQAVYEEGKFWPDDRD